MSEDSEKQRWADVLGWYRAMGVDAAVSDTAIDWRDGRVPGAAFTFGGAVDRADATPPRKPVVMAPPPVDAVRPTPAQATVKTPPAPRRAFAATPPDSAESTARAAARQAKSLEELGAALRAFDGCALKSTAKSLCFYRGSARADLLIIGEAPGRDEDIEGRPFVGRAGQLLDLMLAAIGVGEGDVHITNIVFWRPPGNRTPTPHEAQVCRPFLERQIELVGPRVVLLLGGAAAKHILDTPEGIMKLRGRWFETVIGKLSLKTMASLHPAYLLRSPAAKRQAWRDLLELKQAISKG